MKQRATTSCDTRREAGFAGICAHVKERTLARCECQGRRGNWSSTLQTFFSRASRDDARKYEVETHVLATNDADETDGTGTNSAQGCESMFQKGQVLSIKHIRRRELWGFFN